MTDEQYESLRKHILDLSVKVEEIKLMLKQQNETADRRFSLLYEWCAPAGYKANEDGPEIAPVDVPDDIRKLFGL